MKLFKRIAAIVLAATLVLAMGMTAMAAELPSGTKGADKTITITPPSEIAPGVADDAENTYTVYKVFNATTDGTNISYTSLDGTAPSGFTVDDNGTVYLGTVSDTKTNATGEFPIVVGGVEKFIVPTDAEELTAEQIDAIKNYNGKVLVGTITIEGQTETTVTVPDYGYYYITTTTGTVVTIDSTHKNAVVQDKNTVPDLNKQITKTNAAPDEDGMAGTIFDDAGKEALAELGREVEYTATITVGKGAYGYVFHDKMGTGLEYVSGSASAELELPEGKSFDKNPWYTEKATPDSGDTLTITFEDGIPEGSIITITYKGKVTSDALTIDTGKNTARVNYGDSNSNNHTPDSETNVYNARLTVVKSDGSGNPLAGAGFVIMNSHESYYVKDDSANPTSVRWVSGIENATQYVSDASGNVQAFTGLVDGTYTLIEKTVPTGYNKVADYEFTIAAADSSDNNLKLTASVINQSGQELPSTGGIGTTIFYVVGALLVLGSGVILVTKRRMAS